MNYYFIPVLSKPKVRRVFEARHRYVYGDELWHPTRRRACASVLPRPEAKTAVQYFGRPFETRRTRILFVLRDSERIEKHCISSTTTINMCVCVFNFMLVSVIAVWDWWFLRKAVSVSVLWLKLRNASDGWERRTYLRYALSLHYIVRTQRFRTN